MATYEGKQGWVPSTFLVRLEAGPEPQESLANPGMRQCVCCQVYIRCDMNLCIVQCVRVWGVCVWVCMCVGLHVGLCLSCVYI